MASNFALQVPVLDLEDEIVKVFVEASTVDKGNLDFPFIVRNGVARYAKSAMSLAADFQAKFKAQFTDAGVKGRGFDPIDLVTYSKGILDCAKLLEDGLNSRLGFMPAPDMPQQMAKTLGPSFFGITPAWETTACEPNYGGAFRFTMDGTRTIALADFSSVLQFARRRSKPLSSDNVSLASIRSIFRDMDKDCCQHITDQQCSFGD